jgi:hypothetical protein
LKPAQFRVIQQFQPTLLLDEMEQIREKVGFDAGYDLAHESISTADLSVAQLRRWLVSAAVSNAYFLFLSLSFACTLSASGRGGSRPAAINQIGVVTKWK